MRLIDADKLPVFDMTDNIVGENGAKAIVTHWIQLDFITHAPTVEAIPVEWITKWAEKFYTVINGKTYYMGDGYDTIWDLLEDWERESQYGKD